MQWVTTSGNAISSGGLISSQHNSTGSSTAGGIVLVSGMGQGVTSGTRTGNRIQMLRLTMKGFTSTAFTNTYTPNNNFARIVVALIKNNNSSSIGVGASDWTTWINDWTTGNFTGVFGSYRPDIVPKKVRILKDILINPQNVNIVTETIVAGSTTVGRNVPWKFSINLRRATRGGFTSYSGTTAGATSCETNHIFVYFVQASPAPSDPGSMFSTWTYKLSFLP